MLCDVGGERRRKESGVFDVSDSRIDVSLYVYCLLI